MKNNQTPSVTDFGMFKTAMKLRILLCAALLLLPAWAASAGVVLTTLHSFNGTDGATPYAGLVQGSDGNFYGTTIEGGTNGYGAVFNISTNGVLTNLYSFGGDDGATPYAGLVQGSDGYFYGTTEKGGTHGYGTVFNISTNGMLTSLYSFTRGVDDGGNPYAALVQGSDGYLYGTTEQAGFTNGDAGSSQNQHQWGLDKFVFLHQRR